MLNRFEFVSPRYWPAWLGFGLLWFITKLPQQIQFNLGKLLGHFIYFFPGKLKLITQKNIELCFPELSALQKKQLVQKNFTSLGIGLIETARAWWLPNKKLEHLFTLKGLHYVEEAFSRGKGIIIISPHFTSLEMIGRLLGNRYSFAAMYRIHKKSFIAYIQKNFRKKYKIHLIARSDFRQLLHVLKQNMAVWYAYDIDAGEKRSVFAPFFNIQTASLTTVSRIAQLTDAAIIPVSFYRAENTFHYEVNLAPPLENFPSEDSIQDATRLNAILEESIRLHPEQYVWQYKRFKTRPKGEKRLY